MAAKPRGRSRGRARHRELYGDEDPPRRPGEAPQQHGRQQQQIQQEQQEMAAVAPPPSEQIPAEHTAFRGGGQPRVPSEHTAFRGGGQPREQIPPEHTAFRGRGQPREQISSEHTAFRGGDQPRDIQLELPEQMQQMQLQQQFEYDPRSQAGSDSAGAQGGGAREGIYRGRDRGRGNRGRYHGGQGYDHKSRGYDGGGGGGGGYRGSGGNYDGRGSGDDGACGGYRGSGGNYDDGGSGYHGGGEDYDGRGSGYDGRGGGNHHRDREHYVEARDYDGRIKDGGHSGKGDYTGRGGRGRNRGGRGQERGGRGQERGGRGQVRGGRGSGRETEGRGRDRRGGRGQNAGGRGQGGRDRQMRQRRNEDMLMLADEITTRPPTCTDKRGEAGTEITLQANMFQLNSGPHWNLYQYHVDFLPNVDSRRNRVLLVANLAEALGPTRAFDGMMLYLPKRLPHEVSEFVVKQGHSDEKITVVIKLTGEFPPTSPTCIQMYNVIFKRLFSMIDMQQIGRNFFNPSLAVDIPQHSLSVWPGFVTSILQYEEQPLLCVDISHKILRVDTVLDMMKRLYNSTDRNQFTEACIRKFVGGVVLTRYNNKTYRVDDIDWDSNPTSTFDTYDGPLSYQDYYRKAYNKDISDPNQPLLVSRPKEKERRMGKTDIKLIPEFCVLTGLSEEVRLDFKIMRDVAEHTRVIPPKRVKTLVDFMKKINSTPEVKKELDGWGLKFSDNLVRIGGRQLPREDIFLRDDKNPLKYQQDQSDWSRELRQPLLTTVNLNTWMVVCPRRFITEAWDLCHTFSRSGPQMGIKFEMPYMFEINGDRNEEYLRAIRDNLTTDTQMVLCVLPNNKKDRYDAIKKLCCDSHPVPSQCVLSKTLKKNILNSIANKIMLQLNCKLGGELWRVQIPMRNAMVIGIDTYHDSARRDRSVGGVVCSVNMNMTRYYSRCTFQPRSQELIDGLRVCVNCALKKYHEVNRVFPEKIFVYRDGVGDGQLPSVFNHEIPQLVEELHSVCGPDYKVKLAVVIVKKRINTRLFKVEPGGQQPPSNPLPGTIVDTDITKQIMFDFFLVSQSVRQGTVSPTSYIVVKDTSGLKPDYIQRLTYKMTHLYYNWPGTIRVPAPCQYAHKLAFLVGQSIHKEPSEELANRLYFL